MLCQSVHVVCEISSAVCLSIFECIYMYMYMYTHHMCMYAHVYMYMYMKKIRWTTAKRHTVDSCFKLVGYLSVAWCAHVLDHVHVQMYVYITVQVFELKVLSALVLRRRGLHRENIEACIGTSICTRMKAYMYMYIHGNTCV